MLPSSVGHWNREEFRNIVVFASMLGSSRGLKYGQTVQCNTSLCLMFLQLLLLLMLPAGQRRGPRDPAPRCVRVRHRQFSLTRSRLANFVVVYDVINGQICCQYRWFVLALDRVRGSIWNLFLRCEMPLAPTGTG